MPLSLIAKKLQIKPGMRVMVVNAPNGYFRQLEPLPDGAALVPAGTDLDVVQLFVMDSAELKEHAARAASAVKHGGLLWVCYLKGGKKAGTDLNRDILHDKMEHDYQQIGVSLVSLDDAWSAMRFRPPDKVGK
ncbi:MAG: hypothetical protein JO247_17735 [Chloroflexi bacterium]|nr:hypothetical protein [Chloroflexota bacterium]